MRRVFRSGLVLAAALFATSALAQSSGDTSGPASGSTVKPSAATQKEVADPGATTQAGSPGVAAKAGSEGGPAPKKKTKTMKKKKHT